jgi:hypothetical protein
MEYQPSKEPDDYYRAKLAAFRQAQDHLARRVEEIALRTILGVPSPTRAERRRAQRTKRHLKGLRP